MRANRYLVPGRAAAAAVFLVGSILMEPGSAQAAEPADSSAAATLDPLDAPSSDPTSPGPQSTAPSCSCPKDPARAAKPKFAAMNGAPLDETDEVAALSSVQHALNSAGDGSVYVWQRANGRLSGLVRPISSFRNDEGQICRHVIVMLTTGLRTQKMESTACRLNGGRWQLGG